MIFGFRITDMLKVGTVSFGACATIPAKIACFRGQLFRGGFECESGAREGRFLRYA